MELIHDLAYPLPVIVIAELLGIPTADRDRFKHWSDTLACCSTRCRPSTASAPTERAYRRDHRVHAPASSRSAGARRATI